jgi:anti-sigma B factor antagonist
VAVSAPRFQQLSLDGPRHVVAVEGELDMDTAPDLAEALDEAIASGKTQVVLDMSGVSFVDSTVAHVLVGGARQLRQRLGKLVVVCADPNVCRLLELMRLDLVAPLHPTREAALRSLLDE